MGNGNEFDAFAAEADAFATRIEQDASIKSHGPLDDRLMEEGFRMLSKVRRARQLAQGHLSTMQRLENRIQRCFTEDEPTREPTREPTGASWGRSGPFLYDDEGKRYSVRVVGGSVVAEPVSG